MNDPKNISSECGCSKDTAVVAAGRRPRARMLRAMG